MKEQKFKMILRVCKDTSLGVGKFTTILSVAFFGLATGIALFEDIKFGRG